VEILHDGEKVVAERGEPLAHALIAADRVLLARSGKMHRPRGPYCLRGACDGCLARVDGEPNVMTCRRPARGGERIETQNVLGSRGVDMLRATDFLFPRGMDHHRLFAGVRGLSAVVQQFARRVAGLGRMPERAAPAREARRVELPVLIVGGGAAGLAAAAVVGERALLVDDGLSPGGSLGTLDPERAAALVARATAAGARIRPRTTALALYREPEDERGRIHALSSGPEGVELALVDALCLAPGCHAPSLPFDNNDLPGVISARAALSLWRAGIAIGDRVVIVGQGRFADAFEAAAAGSLSVKRVALEQVLHASGRSRLGGVVVRDGGGERRLKADALIVDGPGAPSFELAEQSGARLRFDPARGYVPEHDGSGEVSPDVWCAGSVAGAEDSERDGARIGQAMLRRATSRSR
jgi:sarcosine oxidase subunit alpha